MIGHVFGEQKGLKFKLLIKLKNFVQPHIFVKRVLLENSFNESGISNEYFE